MKLINTRAINEISYLVYKGRLFSEVTEMYKLIKIHDIEAVSLGFCLKLRRVGANDETIKLFAKRTTELCEDLGADYNGTLNKYYKQFLSSVGKFSYEHLEFISMVDFTYETRRLLIKLSNSGFSLITLKFMFMEEENV